MRTAALATATAPLLLASGGLFQTVVFDQLWWALALLPWCGSWRPPIALVAGRRCRRRPRSGDQVDDGPARIGARRLPWPRLRAAAT